VPESTKGWCPPTEILNSVRSLLFQSLPGADADKERRSVNSHKMWKQVRSQLQREGLDVDK
jgi:hypothetical protein